MVKSYLCESVFVQNLFLEPDRLTRSGYAARLDRRAHLPECSMREGARERYLGGCHFGLLSVLAPSPAVKHGGLPLESSCQWVYGYH